MSWGLSELLPGFVAAARSSKERGRATGISASCPEKAWTEHRMLGMQKWHCVSGTDLSSTVGQSKRLVSRLWPVSEGDFFMNFFSDPNHGIVVDFHVLS